MSERCLELGRELNNGAVITAALPVLAMQALLEERYEEICRLYGETPSMAGEAGDRLWWVMHGGDWAAALMRRPVRRPARWRRRDVDQSAAFRCRVAGRDGADRVGSPSVCPGLISRTLVSSRGTRTRSALLGRLCLKHRCGLAHLCEYVHVKRAALHAHPALDAGGGLDREPRVPLFDLLDPPSRHLIQVPDHPADLDPLLTRQTMLPVVYTKDTSCPSLTCALYLVPRQRVSTSRAYRCS